MYNALFTKLAIMPHLKLDLITESLICKNTSFQIFGRGRERGIFELCFRIMYLLLMGCIGWVGGKERLHSHSFVCA